MIQTISIQFNEGMVYGGYAVCLRNEKREYIFFDVIRNKFPVIIVTREKWLESSYREQIERDLLAIFVIHRMPLKLGTFQVPAAINEYNRKVELEMKNKEIKQICLLVNLGGFEKKLNEYLSMAAECASTIYSLTGDGLSNISEGFRVPVNINRLTTPELHVWSTMINEQLQLAGFPLDQVTILAAGKNYCGQLPLGMVIRDDIRIGA
ncbi:hypothetical protein JI735_33750 (plasmid) [Paenibacillus sonchi]|uniref:Uncharacterized protein n=1 Tax=Paenibacillus sonchi TaxID=373687 RepID=A0A974SG28_9BACL|nr:hypothetical protein [Paenibacillus sonchi]QQZ64617.1 hypothetical protein JI735_33750 [Paenibacillus sonchi]